MRVKGRILRKPRMVQLRVWPYANVFVRKEIMPAGHPAAWCTQGCGSICLPLQMCWTTAAGERLNACNVWIFKRAPDATHGEALA